MGLVPPVCMLLLDRYYCPEQCILQQLSPHSHLRYFYRNSAYVLRVDVVFSCCKDKRKIKMKNKGEEREKRKEERNEYSFFYEGFMTKLDIGKTK